MNEKSAYKDFFRGATGFTPWPYQERLAQEDWPDRVTIPTGLGKTAAVMVAWLYRRMQGCPQTPRHLVYCLPRRALLGQTAQAARRWVKATAPLLQRAGHPRPLVEVMLDGPEDISRVAHPRRPSILMVTREGGQPHSGPHDPDALWVYDETQPATDPWRPQGQRQDAQMPARWLWVSATSRGDRLAAAHPSVLTLRGEDWRLLQTCTLLRAHKPLMRSSVSQTQAARSYYPQNLARLAMARHHQGSLTMVVVNQVDRARAVYRQLLKMGRQPQNTALLHSDLHGDDLALQESILHQPGDRIVVATPSIEAGADVSACALLTELAPWPALVQRAGRCNRYGEQRHAQILWVDMDEETLAQQPYPAHELRQTRDILRGLVDMNMTTVRSVCWSPQQT